MSLKKALNKIVASYPPWDFPPLSEEDQQWLIEQESERQYINYLKPLGFGGCKVTMTCNHPVHNQPILHEFNVPQPVCSKIQEMVENLNPPDPTDTPTDTDHGYAETVTVPECPNVNKNLCILFQNLRGAKDELWRVEGNMDWLELRQHIVNFIRFLLDNCGQLEENEPVDEYSEVPDECMTSNEEFTLMALLGRLEQIDHLHESLTKEINHWRNVINWNINRMVNCASWHQDYGGFGVEEPAKGEGCCLGGQVINVPQVWCEILGGTWGDVQMGCMVVE